MTTVLSRIGSALGRLVHGGDAAEMRVGPGGPTGEIRVPREGDGVWEVRTVQGRPLPLPDDRSYYLYFVLPPELRARAAPASGSTSSTSATASGSSACNTPPRTAGPITGASTNRPRSAGTETPSGCAASGARSSRSPTSIPRARRTRTRPSGSSSAARS